MSDTVTPSDLMYRTVREGLVYVSVPPEVLATIEPDDDEEEWDGYPEIILYAEGVRVPHMDKEEYERAKQDAEGMLDDIIVTLGDKYPDIEFYQVVCS